MGWEKIDHDVWPLIRERLPRPLTTEEVEQDLRWQWGEVMEGKRDAMPGARTLADLWGWSHWRARQALKCEAWKDGRTPAAHLPHTRRTPAAHSETVEPTISTDCRTPAAHLPHTRRTETATARAPANSARVQRSRDPEIQRSDPPVVPKKPDRLAGLWSQLMTMQVEGENATKALTLDAGRRRKLKRCVDALNADGDGEHRLVTLWAWWLFGPDDWWRSKFSGHALVGKLLQPTKIDERALSVPEGWHWNGEHRPEPKQDRSSTFDRQLFDFAMEER